jgi:60S ribosome subunit biogenesis protein NIP7
LPYWKIFIAAAVTKSTHSLLSFLKMRSLTEEETRTLFTKLAHYTGKSLNSLVTPDEDGRLSVFRLQGSRVYYVDKELANLSTSIPRDQLLSMGTQVGKFTKVSRPLHGSGLS